MIISHKHRFIFIKTMKPAGTSLEICLSGICGPEGGISPISSGDERARQARGFRGPQNERVHRFESFPAALAGCVFAQELAHFGYTFETEDA